MLSAALFGLTPEGDCAPLSPRTVVFLCFPLQSVVGLVYTWQVLSGEVKVTAKLLPFACLLLIPLLAFDLVLHSIIVFGLKE